MRIDAQPYEVLTLPKGVYEITPLTFQNRNKWESPAYCANTRAFLDLASVYGWYRFLCEGPNGWHDTLLLKDEAWHRVRKDGRRLDAPLYDPKTDTYSPAWVSYCESGSPESAVGFEAWPAYGLELNTSESKIWHESKNSPGSAMCLNGNLNELHLYASVGEQTRSILDRSPLVVNGNGNRIYGSIEGLMGCVVVNGDDNVFVDVDAEGCSYGDDVFAFNVNGKRNGSMDKPHYGNRLTGCRARQKKRLYPVSHMVGAFRFDDRHDRGKLYNCEALNFMYPYYGNGATNTTVSGFVSAYCEKRGVLASHHTTPDVKPVGNKVTSPLDGPLEQTP